VGHGEADCRGAGGVSDHGTPRIFYLVTFALPAVLAGTVRRLASGRAMWIELGISLMFAAGLTAWSLHTIRAPLEARVEKSVLRLQRGWAQELCGWTVDLR
jgi:hypothetical protein